MKQKGFTLIELLVVIAIIGILSVVVLVNLASSRAKSRDARRVSDLNQARKALELYYDDCGQYPPTLDPSEATGCAGSVTFGNFLVAAPTDTDGTPYVYNYDSGTDTFTLAFTLEGNVNDLGPGAHTLEVDGFH